MSYRCRINSYIHRVYVATSRRFSRCKTSRYLVRVCLRVLATCVRYLRDMYANCYKLARQTTTSVRLGTSTVRLAHDIIPSSGELSCCTLNQICSLQLLHKQKRKRPVKSKWRSPFGDHHNHHVPSCSILTIVKSCQNH